MTETEKLCYFAGLIDGEGHIGCQIYNKKPRPVIQLQMTHKEVVQAFAEHFDMTFRELHSPSHEVGYAKGYKQMYHTRCECHKAYDVVKQLYPYFIVKKQAAEEVLSYYENRACTVCGEPIGVEPQKSAKYCSNKCRQKATRTRKKEKEGNILQNPSNS